MGQVHIVLYKLFQVAKLLNKRTRIKFLKNLFQDNQRGIKLLDICSDQPLAGRFHKLLDHLQGSLAVGLAFELVEHGVLDGVEVQ